jgi:hypothetical protein
LEGSGTQVFTQFELGPLHFFSLSSSSSYFFLFLFILFFLLLLLRQGLAR